MKTQKLLVIVAISCVLFGVSGGAAMAELNGCGDGVLKDEVFNSSLRITGDEPCVIIGCTIQGDIRAIGLPYVLLLNNKVGGIIRVVGDEVGTGVANVIANTVLGEKIVVRDNGTAYVLENDAVTGDITVNFNTKAFVQKNIAVQDITCKENTDLNAFLNLAGGNNTCP